MLSTRGGAASWRRTRAMARKELRQLRRDRRLGALLVFQPLVLLIVFGYAASFDVATFPVAVHGADTEAVVPRLPRPLEVVEVEGLGDRGRAEERLRAGDLAAVVLTGSRPPVVLVDGSQLFAARGLVTALRGAPSSMDIEVLFNPTLATPPILVPALVGLVLAFVGTVATSLGVVRERQGGTIEQLAVMPLRPGEVLAGKVGPYLVISLVDLVLVVVVSVTLFDVPFEGSVPLFATGAVLFLFLTLGVGLLVSTISENQGQAMQLALMVTLPQVLLSGAIFPVEAMDPLVRWLAYLMPLTWFVELARGVMLRAAGWGDSLTALGALAVLAAAAFGLAVLRVRRDLVPARAAAHPPGVGP